MSAVPRRPEPAEDASDADDALPLSDPDLGEVELELVLAALREPRLSAGRIVGHFESQFARWVGRRHGVAVASGALGAWLSLRALGIGPGDEVIASPYGWHPIAHAVDLAGARVVFSEIDYWSGCIDPARVAARITPATRAILAGNVNGHPAAWKALRELADAHGLRLIEDSTEAIGSRTLGRRVGSFGDVSVFDFSQPSALCCGEGGLVLTDDDALAAALRELRGAGERRGGTLGNSGTPGTRIGLQAAISEPTAALACGQLARIDAILERRRQAVARYLEQMQSFEGIKPPYLAPHVDEAHWMVYVVHLGKRFTADATAQIVEDLGTAQVEAVAYCGPGRVPLHLHPHYARQGWKRGDLPLAERIGERALALPLHGHLDEEQIRFIVQTLKDSSLNVGAGAAIY